MSNSSSRRTARHTAPAESAAPAVGRRSTAKLGALTVEIFTADKLPAAARPATAVITPSGAVAFYVLPDADAPAAAAEIAGSTAMVPAAPAEQPVDVLVKRIRKMDAEHKALLNAIYENGGVVPAGATLPRALVMPKGNEKPRTTRMITPDGKRMTDECMTAFARVLESRK